MKLGPVTKLGKGNTSTSKKFNNEFMSANCDVIAFFPIYDQFAVIQFAANQAGFRTHGL